MFVCCFKLLFVNLSIYLRLFEILANHTIIKIKFRFVAPIKTEL